MTLEAPWMGYGKQKLVPSNSPKALVSPFFNLGHHRWYTQKHDPCSPTKSIKHLSCGEEVWMVMTIHSEFHQLNHWLFLLFGSLAIEGSVHGSTTCTVIWLIRLTDLLTSLSMRIGWVFFDIQIAGAGIGKNKRVFVHSTGGFEVAIGVVRGCLEICHRFRAGYLRLSCISGFWCFLVRQFSTSNLTKKKTDKYLTSFQQILVMINH